MLIAFAIIFGGLLYALVAGATHAYAKHRWPDESTHYGQMDDGERRILVPAIWPIYWAFIWPVMKVNELTFSSIEKHAGIRLAKNKARVADLRATRDEIARSNEELEKAEAELEEEIAKEQTHNV